MTRTARKRFCTVHRQRAAEQVGERAAARRNTPVAARLAAAVPSVAVEQLAAVLPVVVLSAAAVAVEPDAVCAGDCHIRGKRSRCLSRGSRTPGIVIVLLWLFLRVRHIQGRSVRCLSAGSRTLCMLLPWQNVLLHRAALRVRGCQQCCLKEYMKKVSHFQRHLH